MKKKCFEVNYLYFGLFFLCLFLPMISSILIQKSALQPRLFFFFYAFGQIVFETTLLILLQWLILRYLSVRAATAFIGVTFLLLALHCFDFFIVRILDISSWKMLSFIFTENFDNFIYLLDASGIPLWAWCTLFILLASLPFLGIALYSWTEKYTHNHPFRLNQTWFYQIVFCIPVALIVWELGALKTISPDAYTALQQTLPWKGTMFQPETTQIALQSPLSSPLSELEMEKKLAQDHTILKHKPNIYLFIIESLREDFITEQIAPNLNNFQKDANHFDLAFANSNGSHLSWFAIFHSQLPIFWKHLQKADWAMGSPALQLLKKWGYSIRLYTSTQLNYYGMEKLLFGKNQSLLDSYQTFHHTPPVSAADTDAQALQAMQKDLHQNPNLQEGQFIIVFLDATHFNYSLPKTGNPQFTPFSNGLNCFKIFPSKVDIELIKNRYKNSIFYIDSLFGDFLKSLKNPEHSIILVTADHGEEFFEHGHLFHGSHLVHEQIHIPLYMKFGTTKADPMPSLVSQIDLFPSLLHHLSGKTFDFFKGSSIFMPQHLPHAVISRFNAGRSPCEFCIHTGVHKLIARFGQTKNMSQSKTLLIRSLWNCKDQCLIDQIDDPSFFIQKEFGNEIEHLYKTNK